MTTTPGGMTVRILLLGSEKAGVQDVMASSARERGLGELVGNAVGGLAAAGRDAVCDEVGRVADSLLELDISDVLAAAWRKHADLRAAGRRTVENPGCEEVVELATHKITSTHRPYVDVFVDDVEITKVELELTLTFVMHGVLAVVRQGWLAEFRTGTCDATAVLTCEQLRLAERSTSFSVPGTIRVQPGIDLRAHAHEPLARGPVPEDPTEQNPLGSRASA